MRKKRPRIAFLGEVKISREGEDAVIDFLDPSVSGMNLKIGPGVDHMTDEEILHKFNEVVAAMEESARGYVHRPVEVPPGKPQVRYSPQGDQWVPRGDVLRCIIDDGGEDGEATIWIDEREFSLREFGRVLTTFAGWGMRITIVPDTDIEDVPLIEVRDPEDEPGE